MRILFKTTCFFVTFLTASTAWAEGLVADASELPAADRDELRQQIAAAKADHPEDFRSVREVKGHRPEVYRRFRNPIPIVGPELRSLGEKALLPMIEALVFEAPPRGDATAREWEALTVGMLEAVGLLRDPRASSTLRLAFREARSFPVMIEAAQGMGRLCDDRSFRALQAALGDRGERRIAAISGLGECRSVASARLLAGELDAATEAAEARSLAAALGHIGSSWAWDALGSESRAEGLEVRTTATEALLGGFLRFQDEQTRTALRQGIGMNAHPNLRAIANRVAHGVDRVTTQQIEVMVTRIERRTARH